MVQSAEAGAPSYVVPTGRWVIVSWSHRANSASGRELGVRVWRATATPGSYTLVGAGALRTLTPGGINTLYERITVTGGDILGLRVGNPPVFPGTGGGASCAFTTGVGDSVRYGVATSEQPPGSTSALAVLMPTYRLNVTARLEADADSDGFGDETQDACPGVAGSDVGLHAGGPAPAKDTTRPTAKLDARRDSIRDGRIAVWVTASEAATVTAKGSLSVALPIEHAQAADRDRESIGGQTGADAAAPVQEDTARRPPGPAAREAPAREGDRDSPRRGREHRHREALGAPETLSRPVARRSFRAMRPLACVCTAGALLLGLPAVNAGAATAIGQLDPGTPSGDCQALSGWVQSSQGAGASYVVPGGRGVIVSWSHRANTTADRQLGVRVWRATATMGSYTLVGGGALHTLSPGGINTFRERIAVSGGDLLGPARRRRWRSILRVRRRCGQLRPVRRSRRASPLRLDRHPVIDPRRRGG